MLGGPFNPFQDLPQRRMVYLMFVFQKMHMQLLINSPTHVEKINCLILIISV